MKALLDSPRFGIGAATGLGLLFFVLSLVGSQQKSLTWDEPSYIATGYLQLTRGDYRFNTSHPPLTQQLVALPLVFLDLEVPDSAELAEYLKTPNPVVFLGREVVFKRNDPLRIQFWSRLPVHLFGAVLVIMVFLWGRQRMGAPNALLAALVVALSPNLLAHAKLATEDLVCTTLMFAAVWAFSLALERPGLGRAIGVGVLTGCAISSKYTALLLLPIYAGLWLLQAFQKKSFRVDAQRLLPMQELIAGMLVTGFVVGLWCRFDYGVYWDGLFSIYGDLEEGYTYYFWGRVSEDPSWYFALVSFVLKVPLSVLLLLAISVGVVARHGKQRADCVGYLIPAAVVVGASFFDTSNFGLRRILPALPFLLMFTGFAVGVRSAAWRRIVVVLAIGTLVEAAVIFPHHLSHLNLLAGGASRAPHVFDDSNVDWGQDLPALARWQQAHPDARRLRLSYFGTAVPDAYGVESTKIAKEEYLSPKRGFYAVSVHQLIWLRKLAKRTGRDLDWLAKYQPVERVAYSIYIYRFPESYR